MLDVNMERMIEMKMFEIKLCTIHNIKLILLFVVCPFCLLPSVRTAKNIRCSPMMPTVLLYLQYITVDDTKCCCTVALLSFDDEIREPGTSLCKCTQFNNFIDFQ